MDKYWQTIQQTLKGFWKRDDLLVCTDVFKSSGESCQLCGYSPITWNHVLRNVRTSRTLTVGSMCIHNFKRVVKELEKQDVIIAYPVRLERMAAMINQKYPGAVQIGLPAGIIDPFEQSNRYAEPADGIQEADFDQECYDSDDLAPEGMGLDEIDYDSLDYDEREKSS